MSSPCATAGRVPKKMPIHPGRIAMLQRGVTQAELATKASKILGRPMSRSLVSLFLIGERTPDEAQARALSRALSGATSIEDWTSYTVPKDAMRQRRKPVSRSRPKVAPLDPTALPEDPDKVH